MIFSDSDKLLMLDGQYTCEGNISQIRISLFDQLMKQGALWQVKSYLRFINPKEHINHIDLIHPVWWKFGEVEFIDLNSTRTLVRFYQTEFPDEQEILERERAIRNYLTRPPFTLWLLDNFEMQGKVLDYLGKELLDHRQTCLRNIQYILVRSMGLIQYPLSAIQAGPVEISPIQEVNPSEKVKTRNFPETHKSEAWETIMHGENKELLRLWMAGLTAKEIGLRTGKTEKTVLNKLTILRRVYGEEHIPRRKKNTSG